MLDQVKSKYILKIIFDNLHIGRKLDLIRNNKEIQNKINIKILNYKVYSGRYITKEKDGKIKIFDGYSDKVIYEGAYLNGKRHGYGKEYYYYKRLHKNNYFFNNKNFISIKENEDSYLDEVIDYNFDEDKDNILFEGEYVKGKIWKGKGKHFKYNNLIFEGEYLNGEKHRKGKDYDYKGTLKLEGEFLNDFLINGTVFQYDSKGKLKNKEQYLNGERIKKKEENFTIEEIEKIMWEFSERKLHNTKLSRKYDLNKMEKNGIEKVYNDYDELKFEGEFLYNHRIKGKEYFNSGNLRYEGEYLYDKKWNGKGYDENGNVIYEIKNGNGAFKEYDDDDKLLMEGTYKNGKLNGLVKKYFSNGELVLKENI